MAILNLANIDFPKIVQQFLKGEYDNLTREDLPRVKSKIHKITRGAISDNYSGARFQIYDPHSRRLTIFVSNRSHLGSLRLCEWHRLPLSPNNVGIGVPVSLQTHTDAQGVLHNLFHGDGLYCGWSCVLADCEKSWRYGPNERQLLRQMWFSIFPNKPLPALALDYRLLAEHSGDMTQEEYFSTCPAGIWSTPFIKMTALPGHYITTE